MSEIQGGSEVVIDRLLDACVWHESWQMSIHKLAVSTMSFVDAVLAFTVETKEQSDAMQYALSEVAKTAKCAGEPISVRGYSSHLINTSEQLDDNKLVSEIELCFMPKEKTYFTAAVDEQGECAVFVINVKARCFLMEYDSRTYGSQRCWAGQMAEAFASEIVAAFCTLASLPVACVRSVPYFEHPVDARVYHNNYTYALISRDVAGVSSRIFAQVSLARMDDGFLHAEAFEVFVHFGVPDYDKLQCSDRVEHGFEVDGRFRFNPLDIACDEPMHICGVPVCSIQSCDGYCNAYDPAVLHFTSGAERTIWGVEVCGLWQAVIQKWGEKETFRVGDEQNAQILDVFNRAIYGCNDENTDELARRALCECAGEIVKGFNIFK